MPSNAPAVQAEATATRIFGEPLDAQVAVVQRAAGGLSQSAQATRSAQPQPSTPVRAGGSPIAGLAGALPIPNTARCLPGSRERSTTVITFLYFRPGTSAAGTDDRR